LVPSVDARTLQFGLMKNGQVRVGWSVHAFKYVLMILTY